MFWFVFFTLVAGRVVANVPFRRMLPLVSGPCSVHPTAWVQLCARCVAGSWSSWKSIFGKGEWKHGFQSFVKNGGAAQVGRDLGRLLPRAGLCSGPWGESVPHCEAWAGASTSPGAGRSWREGLLRQCDWLPSMSPKSRAADTVPCLSMGSWARHAVQGCHSPSVKWTGSAYGRKQLFAHQGEGWCMWVDLSNSLPLFLLINKLIVSYRNPQQHWAKIGISNQGTLEVKCKSVKILLLQSWQKLSFASERPKIRKEKSKECCNGTEV